MLKVATYKNVSADIRNKAVVNTAVTCGMSVDISTLLPGTGRRDGRYPVCLMGSNICRGPVEMIETERRIPAFSCREADIPTRSGV